MVRLVCFVDTHSLGSNLSVGQPFEQVGPKISFKLLEKFRSNLVGPYKLRQDEVGTNLELDWRQTNG